MNAMYCVVPAWPALKYSNFDLVSFSVGLLTLKPQPRNIRGI